LTIVYVDTSALLKRVVVEPESPAVRSLLRESHASGDLLTASSFAWLEVWRALRWAAVADVAAVTQRALSGIAEFPLSDPILLRARRVGLHQLRACDALHLASAIAIGADALLTYDNRLAESAATAGINVLAPT
jgi:uncharacterized protein